MEDFGNWVVDDGGGPATTSVSGGICVTDFAGDAVMAVARSITIKAESFTGGNIAGIDVFVEYGFGDDGDA